MNSVRVRYYSIFCVAAGFCREETIELGSEQTLWGLVDRLSVKYGEDFRKKVFNREGYLKVTAWILVNGVRVEPGNLGLQLNKDDTVIFSTPLLVGG